MRQIQHKEYSHEEHINDIALLEVEKPFEFTSSVQPIELEYEELQLESKVEIVGWGKTHNWGGPSDDLKFNVVKVSSNYGCHGVAHGGLICLAHKVDNGACSGSAVQNGKLIGIANFIRKKCGSSYDDAYAKIKHFTDWIADHMKSTKN